MSLSFAPNFAGHSNIVPVAARGSSTVFSVFNRLNSCAAQCTTAVSNFAPLLRVWNGLAQCNIVRESFVSRLVFALDLINLGSDFKELYTWDSNVQAENLLNEHMNHVVATGMDKYVAHSVTCAVRSAMREKSGETDTVYGEIASQYRTTMNRIYYLKVAKFALNCFHAICVLQKGMLTKCGMKIPPIVTKLSRVVLCPLVSIASAGTVLAQASICNGILSCFSEQVHKQQIDAISDPCLFFLR